MSFIRTRTFIHRPVPIGYDNLTVEELATGRKYVTPDGKKYPSITTILGIRSKDHIEGWKKAVGEVEAARVLRLAGIRGNALHDLAEKYIRNDEVVLTGKEMPHIKLLFDVCKKELDKSLGTVILQECALYSHYLKLAGRVDLIAEWDGKLSIIDFKTSRAFRTKEDITNYFLQKTAYAIMFEERTGIPIVNLVTLMMVDSQVRPQIFKEHRDNWAEELLKARAEYEEFDKARSLEQCI